MRRMGDQEEGTMVNSGCVSSQEFVDAVFWWLRVLDEGVRGIEDINLCETILCY